MPAATDLLGTFEFMLAAKPPFVGPPTEFLRPREILFAELDRQFTPNSLLANTANLASLGGAKAFFFWQGDL